MDMEKILTVLFDLIEEQENVEITFTLKKKKEEQEEAS